MSCIIFRAEGIKIDCRKEIHTTNSSKFMQPDDFFIKSSIIYMKVIMKKLSIGRTKLLMSFRYQEERCIDCLF